MRSGIDSAAVDPDVRPDVGDAPVNASSAVGSEPDDVLDDELVADLRAHYADSDSALAELLGRELPWKEL